MTVEGHVKFLETYEMCIRDSDFSFGIFTPSLKVGAYTEHRAREYNTRFFIYSWKNGLPGAYKVMNLSLIHISPMVSFQK